MVIKCYENVTTSFPGSFPWLAPPPSQGTDPGNEVENVTSSFETVIYS